MEPVFELVYEGPDFENIFDPKQKVRIITREHPYACSWLKVGKDETCGKPSKEKFCSTHRRLIKNGATIPISCFGCNVGITRGHYLCEHCEKYSGL